MRCRLVCDIIIVRNFGAVCVPTSTWSALGNANRSRTSKYMFLCLCMSFTANYIDHCVCHVIVLIIF